MRRPDADLEEKREPRVTGEPKRKTAGDMRWRYEVMERGLTLAAIEKPPLSLGGRNRSLCPIADLPARTGRRGGKHEIPICPSVMPRI